MADRRPLPERPIRHISMPDKISKLHRSWVMSCVKGRDTKPELIARSLLHNLGYRFTVNGPRNRKLPGKPDIVLRKYRTVVFVHGCFWHSHKGCKKSSIPKANFEFWKSKLERTRKRDAENIIFFKTVGFRVGIIWECAIKDKVFEKIDIKDFVEKKNCWEIG